ncbi:MAG: hypothetical protein JWQ11_565 [Rhizobacter sp.]|nr:hypothetical protein [Rhizobacter sp.]
MAALDLVAAAVGRPLRPLPFELAGAGAAAPLRRVKLSELDTPIHCSIVGTCLGTRELRKLVAKYKALDAVRASDLDVHHAAVELAGEPGEGTKALNKMLDQRHELAVRRFKPVGSAGALIESWQQALKAGDVPGAYWAVMTHPLADTHVRHVAFGDVHMLSHLVGAANRADVRRLVDLEAVNASLQDKVERQQRRMQEAAQAHRGVVDGLRAEIEGLRGALARQTGSAGGAGSGSGSGSADGDSMARALVLRDAEVALQSTRREAAERSAQESRAQASRLQAEVDRASKRLSALAAEVHAMEAQAEEAVRPGARADSLSALRGRRVLYVGGRPSSNASIRSLCERVGIDLTVHDGGIEDRKGLLAAAIPGSELVLFPVDCVDHDSVFNLKRHCLRHDVTWMPLRTAGNASFLAALVSYVERLGGRASGGLAPMCCRHHG